MKLHSLYLGLTGLAFLLGYRAADHNPVKHSRTYQSPQDYLESQILALDRIIDGDTLDVIDKGGNIFRIRLHGIDTPERGKPFYKTASRHLHRLCQDQPIRLSHLGDGKYGRLSARVKCGAIEVNTALVQAGLAITAIKYADDLNFYTLQAQAQQACLGLWRQDIYLAFPEYRLAGHSPIKGAIRLQSLPSCLSKTKKPASFVRMP